MRVGAILERARHLLVAILVREGKWSGRPARMRSPRERGVNQQAHHASWRKIDGIGKQQFAAK